MVVMPAGDVETEAARASVGWRGSLAKDLGAYAEQLCSGRYPVPARAGVRCAGP